MTEQLNLTAAEIDALLAVADDQKAAATARARLGIDRDAALPVRQAGLGSLLVRGLARMDEADLALVPDAEGVLRALTGAGVWAEVGMLDPDGVDAAQFFDAGTVRVLVTPQPVACFAVYGLDPTGGLHQQVLGLVHTFLDGRPEGTVSVKLSRGGHEAEVAIGKRPGQPWRVSSASDSREHDDAAAAYDALVRQLTAATEVDPG